MSTKSDSSTLGPLRRLIEKTRRMREAPFESELDEPEAPVPGEAGEWHELEREIYRLGRELRGKTIRLSREKTELRTIMSAVSEAVLAISADKRVLFYNSQFAFLFNPANAEATVGEVLRETDVIKAYEDALNDGAYVRREVRLVTKGENLPRDFQLSVTPLKKKHNQEVYGVVGIFYDITEMKQAERIRIEFVGNVSHELRTPLTTINGYLQTLSADFQSGRLDQAQEFLDIVRQNVGRLKNLVEDLLDLSSLESGKELRLETVDVRDITESVLSQVNTKNHKIRIDYGFDHMTADPGRMEQVLRNLMENAVRYVPEGRNIRIDWRLGPNGTHELHVIDDGPGIAPEHQARLFERFYRIDEARARETGGTGIGLSLVKHIVQRHGGQVIVRSRLGKGSEFICEFPGD
jgi:two-component system phosphate regulon sensor histidine kinase PhoR